MVRLASDKVYYVRIGFDGQIIAGPFEDKQEAIKARNKFLRDQRKKLRNQQPQ